MIIFDAQGIEMCLSYSGAEILIFQFSDFLLSGVIRIGSPL